MVKRSFPPGIRGKRRKPALSDYAKELIEKQKLRNWYGLSERQFKKYVKEILQKRGRVENLGQRLIEKLESRLDNVVFRLGFAKSRFSARQLVSHGYFLINKKPVNIPSFELKKGDVISLKESKKKSAVFKNFQTEIKKYEIPQWLKLNIDKLEGEFIRKPSLEEVVPPAEISTIFEYYSR